MRSSILARIPGFRQRIIPEPSFPSQGSQARGTRLLMSMNFVYICNMLMSIPDFGMYMSMLVTILDLIMVCI